MIRFWTPAACRAARSLMLEGIEGTLGVRARLDVQDHLAGCAACAEELADLAAAHHAVRRAFAPYRQLKSPVAPGRARLGAHRPRRAGPLLDVVRLFGRPAEQALVFAVLTLAFLGTLSGGSEQRSASRGAFAAAGYVRAPDDPGGLVRPRALQSDRIPVGDGLVIGVAVPSEERGAGERLRQGLQPQRP